MLYNPPKAQVWQHQIAFLPELGAKGGQLKGSMSADPLHCSAANSRFIFKRVKVWSGSQSTAEGESTTMRLSDYLHSGCSWSFWTPRTLVPED